MHPQLAATLLGRPLPPQPGESGATFEPERLPLVEPRTGNQAAEAGHWQRFRTDRWRVSEFVVCGRCGEFDKRGALAAVAGRMFRR